MFALNLLPLVVLVAVGIVCVAVWLQQGNARMNARLRELSGAAPSRGPGLLAGKPSRSMLPRMASTLVPVNPDLRTRLQRELWHAGLYSRQALVTYVSVKLVLLLAPWLIGMLVGLLGFTSLLHGVMAGGMLSGVGLIGPGVWLNRRISRRRAALRRGLSDVIDVLVLCLEAGLSLPAAFQLVTGEVRSSYPMLGLELRLVQREMHLGRTLGQALRSFADRCGVDEVSVLAAIVEQTERLGASLVKALRIQADQLRFRRVQQSEEQAQKAGAKILFPTLLFIFPAIFIILLGPAAVQVHEVMNRHKKSPPGAAVKKPLEKVRR